MYPFKSVFFCILWINNSEIAELQGNSIFSFLRSLHIALHSGCTSLHSHQQCKRVSPSLYPHYHLWFLVLLILAILTGVKWHLIMVLICISLMMSDVDIFSCVCSTSGCLLWKMFIHVFCPFLNLIICFLGVEFDKFFINFGY